MNIELIVGYVAVGVVAVATIICTKNAFDTLLILSFGFWIVSEST